MGADPGMRMVSSGAAGPSRVRGVTTPRGPISIDGKGRDRAVVPTVPRLLGPAPAPTRAPAPSMDAARPRGVEHAQSSRTRMGTLAPSISTFKPRFPAPHPSAFRGVGPLVVEESVQMIQEGSGWAVAVAVPLSAPVSVPAQATESQSSYQAGEKTGAAGQSNLPLRPGPTSGPRLSLAPAQRPPPSLPPAPGPQHPGRHLDGLCSVAVSMPKGGRVLSSDAALKHCVQEQTTLSSNWGAEPAGQTVYSNRQPVLHGSVTRESAAASTSTLAHAYASFQHDRPSWCLHRQSAEGILMQNASDPGLVTPISEIGSSPLSAHPYSSASGAANFPFPHRPSPRLHHPPHAQLAELARSPASAGAEAAQDSVLHAAPYASRSPFPAGTPADPTGSHDRSRWSRAVGFEDGHGAGLADVDIGKGIGDTGAEPIPSSNHPLDQHRIPYSVLSSDRPFHQQGRPQLRYIPQTDTLRQYTRGRLADQKQIEVERQAVAVESGATTERAQAYTYTHATAALRPALDPALLSHFPAPTRHPSLYPSSPFLTPPPTSDRPAILSLPLPRPLPPPPPPPLPLPLTAHQLEGPVTTKDRPSTGVMLAQHTIPIPPNCVPGTTLTAVPAPAANASAGTRMIGPRPVPLSRTPTRLPLAHTLPQQPQNELSSEQAQRTSSAQSQSSTTLTRRAAISRHANSYASNTTALAYSHRPYSSASNAAQRLSLISRLSDEIDEAIADTTADYLYGGEADPANGHGAIQAQTSTFLHNGHLTDSPPEQSDAGHGSRNSCGQEAGNGAESSHGPVSAYGAYGAPSPDSRPASSQGTEEVLLAWHSEPPLSKQGAADPARAAWERMDRQLGRRVNSALDAERGEWVPFAVVRRAPGEADGSDSRYGASPGPMEHLIDLEDGTDVRGRGYKSPGEFSVSDYLAFGNELECQHSPFAPRTLMPVPQPYWKSPQHAEPIVPAGRPFLQINTTLALSHPHSTRSTPLTYSAFPLPLPDINPALRGDRQHQVLDQIDPPPVLQRPALPPIQTGAARAVQVSTPQSATAAGAAGSVTAATATRRRTGRSRHLALGSSVRVQYGRVDTPSSVVPTSTQAYPGVRSQPTSAKAEESTDHSHNYGPYRRTTRNSTAGVTRASTLTSAVYAPSAYPSEAGSVDYQTDLSICYNLDDSLFPMAPSPTSYDNECRLRSKEPEGTKRRRTRESSVGAGVCTGKYSPQGMDGPGATLRIFRERTRKSKGAGWNGISSADYALPDTQDRRPNHNSVSDETGTDGLVEVPSTRGKRNRDGLTRLDTQIAHALRAFKSRSTPAHGSARAQDSPETVSAPGSAYSALSPMGSDELSRQTGAHMTDSSSVSGTEKAATAMARWGSGALSRVRTRSQRRSNKARSPREVQEEAERQGREVVNLDTPLPSMARIAVSSASHAEKSAHLQVPTSPVSPVLITPPTVARPLPVPGLVSPPQNGLGLGVPIDLRSTYSLYNRPDGLTLAGAARADGDGRPSGASGGMYGAAEGGKPRVLPKVPTPLGTAAASSPPNALPCPRSSAWPANDRDAAQLLRVKDLDTGHSCEVAMSRVEQALAAFSR